MCQAPEKLLFLSHSEKCNRSLKKSATATSLGLNRSLKKSATAIALFYEKSATDAYFLG
jgi:hypothetical protein